MKFLALLTLPLLLAGCLTTPVSKSGGLGSVTVTNTNVNVIIAAAQSAFAGAGYSIGPANYPVSISFDKPAGTFSKIMWGSYDTPLTMRATLVIDPIPGSSDFRLSVRVTRVTDAGDAGFEDSTKMLGVWGAEFNPILRNIQSAAAGAGPGSPASL